MNAGGLSGAEMDVLSEFLSQPLSDWQRYAASEGYEDDEDGELTLSQVDPEDDSYSEHFPTKAMIRRVNQILQNHC